MKTMLDSALGLGAKAMVGGLLALAALACGPYGNYRVVKTQPHKAGEVALEGDRALARQKAEAYMTSECSGGYEIVEEGEEVTGSQSSSSSNTQPTKDIFGRKTQSTQTSTNTVNTREWRVKYKCKDGEAPPSEKAATPADPQKKSQIREVVVRF